MIRSPVRAGSRTGSGTPINAPATTSKSGVNASSTCSTVRRLAAVNMNRRTTRYDGPSRASAVEAVRSMRMGDSIRSESGKTTPPYAARLTVACGRRAMAALTTGSSSPMSNQLPASGSHVARTSGEVRPFPSGVAPRAGWGPSAGGAAATEAGEFPGD